ncbi:hypothetical protein [Deinococcus petrolearius]|uniref:DUF4388 domain-containing protein n=1 Tax=Deinococcus petrolearius TaxID=1751295 RepID=A0ABW1DNB8_9DEIO
MALFGDLEHHALTDLARVLKSQTGTLYFHEAYQRRTLELTLRKGDLRAMYLDGFPVQTSEQVRDILRQLHSQGRGAFEFQRRDFPANVPGFYDLPLVELLQDFTEASIPPDQLPHPETRFLPVTPEPTVPPSLADTWLLLQPHLASGASASELAKQVGRSEREVLGMLHRLRAVDLVAPQRAATQQVTAPVAVAATVDGSAPVATPSAPAALVHRLLGALRRLTGTART